MGVGMDGLFQVRRVGARQVVVRVRVHTLERAQVCASCWAKYAWGVSATTGEGTDHLLNVRKTINTCSEGDMLC
jgi:hypothetical protein